MDSEFKVALKEKDRVLGSLSGNFIVYGRPYVAMYNNRGKKIFSKKVKNNIKPTLSPNGKYFALTTYADRSPTDFKAVKFSMYDPAGKFLWKMDNPKPKTFYIADNGAIFGLDGVEGIPQAKLYMYDQYGDIRSIVSMEAYHGMLISPGGGKVIIDKARGGLDVFDSLGTLLGTLPVSKNYAFDQDERYIATFFQGIFRLFQDEKEVAIIESPEQVIREMKINVEKNLAVLLAAKRLEIYELTTGRQIWEYQIPEGKQWFSSLDMSADGRFIAVGMDINRGNPVPKDERHIEGYVYLFPTTGKSSFRVKETYKLWSPGLPRGVFSPTGGSLMLQTREKLEKYKIKP
jgi:hypothetical protein